MDFRRTQIQSASQISKAYRRSLLEVRPLADGRRISAEDAEIVDCSWQDATPTIDRSGSGKWDRPVGAAFSRDRKQSKQSF